jgi:hypothetical protein
VCVCGGGGVIALNNACTLSVSLLIPLKQPIGFHETHGIVDHTDLFCIGCKFLLDKWHQQNCKVSEMVVHIKQGAVIRFLIAEGEKLTGFWVTQYHVTQNTSSSSYFAQLSLLHKYLNIS